MADGNGEQIAAAARSWIGTPFHHRASLKGVGCDCIGLVLGVWREIGGPGDVELPIYAPNGPGIGAGERLKDGVGAYLRPLGGIQPQEGDVIALRMADGGPAQHLGIVTDAGEEGQFVHAYSRRGVVETRLSAHWRSRIVTAFRMPVEGA